mgnify:CR=1 FL=1
MEVIVPAAGLSTRFPNMKPKYLLYDYKGEMMLMNALRTFRQKGFRIHIGILKEHEEKYGVIEQIQHEWADNINYVIIDKPTRGPADTVYQIIKAAGLHTSEIFIKDCDSFFEHKISEDNYVCISKIYENEYLKKVSSKSFVITNDQGVITDIVEKQVERTKHYVAMTQGSVAAPVIVTLYQDRVSFVDKVPIVPIHQLGDFLDEFFGNLENVETIRKETQ